MNDFGEFRPRDPVRTFEVFGSGPLSDYLRAHLRAPAANDPTTIVVGLDSGDFRSSLESSVEQRAVAIAATVRTAFDRAREVGADHIIAVSSAAVCGAWRARPTIAGDEPAVTLAEAGWAGDLARGEEFVKSAADEFGPDTLTVTYLRNAPLVGPGIDTLMTRHFEVPRLLELRGTPKRWQFLHLDDLVAAVQVVADGRLAGVLPVGTMRPTESGQWEPDAQPTDALATIVGRRTISLTEPAAFSIAERLHRAGLLVAPTTDLAYAVFPWTVDSSELLAAGWRPEVSAAECARQVVQEIRGRRAVGGRLVRGRGVMALGAVGAAVALAGTVAVVRRSRGVS